MSKYVQVKKQDGETKNFPIEESNKPGYNYHIPKGTDGFHLKSKESLVKHFRKKFPKADDITVKP